MAQLYLAEYQMRLLLCTPWRKKALTAGGEEGAMRLLWRCGCSAVRCRDRKYEITACNDHLPLLREIREDDDRFYERSGERELCPIPHTRLRNFRVV